MSAYQAPVLDGVTLPHIAEYKVFGTFRGGVTVLANGTVRRDLVNPDRKRRFLLAWPKLEDAEQTSLETLFETVAKNIVEFTAPDGSGPYSVTLDPQSDVQELEYFRAGSPGTLYTKTTIILREE